ncbi:methylated-DNA--[protein]-cysteine S-methyltransferase [Kibdelosporangium phytohabitans]|uniref:methylated-DNA--[protein]-cysteine S-methyltransferase n=1 Tax=Kibdelosporangium phytohabitans TaxID=860235 RepID=A0A0N9HPL7_9PSEU|nr:methylated-DNA--[protein]-cysteine S-methyltransferase [Kibdelosporangium phytohabitans]ALG06616.1 cysteine methyltransferase [Kibdelosporangium phytohabitans]MBE1467822.1 methylated-DNA-[protein]-cysteine S-methyltransferase [Kibdelosporangium phytohabitans]
MTEYSVVDTPIGPFTAVVRDDEVVASGWTGDVNDLVGLIHPSIRPVEVRERADLGQVTKAVAAYHSGDVGAIEDIVVNQRSGEFIQHAWKVLRTVPAGAPVTYAQFADLAGRPSAVRAAASACARNPVALFVPCHRVLRTDGSIGGFRWGLPAKRWLLEHETV